MFHFTERQEAIIRFYQQQWRDFAKEGETTHPVFAYRDFSDNGLDFIYFDEITKIIEVGFTGFILEPQVANNMWCTEHHNMHITILDY